MRLKVVIVGGHAQEWIKKCLESVACQTDVGWEACVILDPVGDDTYSIAKTFESKNIQVYLNATQQYQSANFIQAIRVLQPHEEDVLVFGPDADDWLYDEHALSIIRDYYTNFPELLVTYGGLARYTNTGLEFFSDEVIRKYKTFDNNKFKNIRKHWHGCHLKTMKYGLFKQIKDEDFRDAQGRYFQVNGDMALMIPALEMAGFERTRRIF